MKSKLTPEHIIIEEKKKRGILIVDDEQRHREVFTEVLTSVGFTNIFQAQDGIEALSLLSEKGSEIYLILLDLKMPNLDGFGVIKYLLNVHCIAVGIIMVTAYGTKRVKSDFFRMGSDTIIAADYFEKPIHPNNLIAEIESTLDKVNEKRIQQLEFSSDVYLTHLKRIESEVSKFDILHEIKNKLDILLKKQHNFFEQLGIECHIQP